MSVNPASESQRGQPAVQASGTASLVYWPQLWGIPEFCLFLTAYFFAYRFGMSFSEATASPFWFPDSVLLCALLLSPPSRWWLFILATLPVRLLVAVPPDVPGWFLVATFAIDAARNLLTAVLLRRLIAGPIRLESMRSFALFCLVAVLLVPAVFAFGGAAARHALGHAYWPAWEQWFLGNALAHLVITPAIFFWVFEAPGRIRTLSARRGVEAGLLVAGLILSGYFAFDIDAATVGRFSEPRFYAPVPFLFWAAVRFGMLGASGVVVIVAFLSSAAAISGHGPFLGQSPAETATALQHFLLLRAVPLYVVAIVIERAFQVERLLRQSEERFRHLADAAPVLIWIAEADRHCTYFNQRWLDFTGRNLEQEIGDGWTAHVHPEDIERRVGGYQAAFAARQPFTIEYRLRRHDGQYRWMLTHAVPRLAEDGEFLGYIGSCLDITERRNDELELQQAREELVHLSRVSSLGTLSTALAHELNQPLGSILSNAQAALRFLDHRPPNLPEVLEILKDIAAEDRRAGDVIQRMRRLLKRGQPQYLPLDVNVLLQEVVTLMRSELMHRGARVELLLGSDVMLVPGDRVSLQQVIINLLLNGCDAMQHLPAVQRRLQLYTYQRQDVEVIIEVSDSGNGINPEDLQRLFQPFFTTKQQGLGVGLAISKSIIDAHGGRLWADNNVARGATFHFALPLKPATATAETRSATVSTKPVPGPAAPQPAPVSLSRLPYD